MTLYQSGLAAVVKLQIVGPAANQTIFPAAHQSLQHLISDPAVSLSPTSALFSGHFLFFGLSRP